MKVELGAGTTAREGWLAVDVNPAHADVIADATVLPFRTGTVTELRSVDVLEHLSYRWSRRALAEWARVMMSGASLFVQVPSAGTIMRWFAARDDRLLSVGAGVPHTHLGGATWRLLGGPADGTYADAETWRFNAHYALFDAESLRQDLMSTDFVVESIEENPHPNLLAHAIRR